MPDRAAVPLDVVLVSGGLPHHGGTLAERSLGGSETAAILVARALGRRGHRVTVFSPGHQGGRWDGVQYLPIESFPGYVMGVPHDVCIMSRAPDWFQVRPQCSIGMLWCHDLATKPQRPTLGGVMWTVDMVLGLSDFHVQQLRSVHAGIPPEWFRQSRNGLDLAAVRAAGEGNAPPRGWRVAYGSRPERGIEALLLLAEVAAQNGLPYEFCLAGYENTPPHLEAIYAAWTARAQQLPNVRWLGWLKQSDWHRLLHSSALWLYPGCRGGFREISCLCAMEAMACGTVPITIGKGAVPETIGDAGVVLGSEGTDPLDPEYLMSFLQAMESLRQDPMRLASLRRAGLQRAAGLDWSGVAEQWEGWWMERLAQRTASPQRMRQALARGGEREALAHLAAVGA